MSGWRKPGDLTNSIFFLPQGLHIMSLFLKLKSKSCSVVSDSLQPHRLYSPWNSPGQNSGVGSLSLLQGIFPTQGSNPGLPHCRQILYRLSHKGSPRVLEWVAYPFSRGSSWPRNWTEVSCIAGRFFPKWAIREAPLFLRDNLIQFWKARWAVFSSWFCQLALCDLGQVNPLCVWDFFIVVV